MGKEEGPSEFPCDRPTFRAPQPATCRDGEADNSGNRRYRSGNGKSWTRKSKKTSSSEQEMKIHHVAHAKRTNMEETATSTPVSRDGLRKQKDDKFRDSRAAQAARSRAEQERTTSSSPPLQQASNAIQHEDAHEEIRPGAFAVAGINGDTVEEYDSVIISERDAQSHVIPAEPGSTTTDEIMIDAQLVDPEAERQQYIHDAEAQIREDILAQAAEAELIDPEIKKRRRRRRCAIGIALLIAVGVGGLMAGLFSNRSSSAELPPTMAPSHSVSPSYQPTFAPSAAPTVFHDECQDAEVVNSLPFFDSGGTALAQELGDDNPALVCPNISGFDRGVWRRVEGTGKCLSASATGTNFDPVLAVYTGSCEELLCITRNDDASSPSGEVTWSSQAEETYYILVAGAGSSTGDYTMTISVSSYANGPCI